MIKDAKESGSIDEDYEGGDELPGDTEIIEGCCKEVG